MKSKLIISVALFAMLVILAGCKPDKMEIEVYTSDIQKAITEGVVEVPLTATFSIMGKDEDGVLRKSSTVAKRYLDDNAEFKMSKGDWGDVMVVKCSVPMGTEAALKTYLANKPIPYALTVSGSTVKLGPTEHLQNLNEDLGGINMMLGLEMPANSTVVRFVGDMAEAPEVTAFAVFVDKKPELIFKKKIDRRASVEINYRGEEASVYSEITPVFSIKF